MKHVIKDSAKVIVLSLFISFLVFFVFAQTGTWSEPTASPPGENVFLPYPVPVGTILPYGGATAPSGGWLIANGTAISRTEYANLFAAIGCNFGCPDSSRFNLPDLRGTFLRGVDAGSGRDPSAASRTALAPGGNTGNAVGSFQSDMVGNHNHYNVSVIGHDGGPGISSSLAGYSPSGSGLGSETRPKNVYVNFIVKY